jgi:chitinase
MFKLKVFLFLFIIFDFCGRNNQKEITVENIPLNIMAYYVPEKEVHPDQLPLDKLTHIIFSFSKVIDGEMKFMNEKSGILLEQLVAQKQFHPHLRVMIACGGWGADGFSDAVSSDENRKKFIASTISFIEKYRLDGVDIDWEYPAIPAAGTKASPEDKVNFTVFMKGLREALDKLDRRQVLTFASAGWKRYYNNVEMVEVLKYADYMNVMTYDQAGGGNRFTSHHTALGWIDMDDLADTPLGKAMTERNDTLPEGETAWEPQSAEKIIDFCISKGVKPEQIVIGGAFYGRGWKGVPPENNGLYQPNKGPMGGGIRYHQLVADFENKNGFEKRWDETAKAPYLYNPTDSIFITYDDTASVKLKTRYAIEKGLGGIMFWQLSGDSNDKSSLVRAIYDEAVNQ